MPTRRTVPPVSPGEMLDEEFLKPLGLTKYRLAKDIGVPPQRIGDIVAGKRAITADTDLRLCRYFGLSDGWWVARPGQLRHGDGARGDGRHAGAHRALRIARDLRACEHMNRGCYSYVHRL